MVWHTCFKKPVYFGDKLRDITRNKWSFKASYCCNETLSSGWSFIATLRDLAHQIEKPIHVLYPHLLTQYHLGSKAIFWGSLILYTFILWGNISFEATSRCDVSWNIKSIIYGLVVQCSQIQKHVNYFLFDHAFYDLFFISIYKGKSI